MLLVIVLLPLLGFFSGSLFGRYLGKGACLVTVSSTFITFFLSSYLLFTVISTGVSYELKTIPWIDIYKLKVSWSFCFDSLTCVMLFVVTFISSLVHLYSEEYMWHDPHLPRFMSYLSLFTFFMIILVTANNFLQMFVGWEGVGVSSYLLINFWFTRIQANKSAIKAMLVNRVGDFFILLAMFTIYVAFETLDYDVVFSLAPAYASSTKIQFWFLEVGVLDLISILLFLGAMGKSAQLGLHTWLPDAMEGPTPVSALIHAATMVTAGVFLIVRCSHLFEHSPLALSFVTVIGSMTAFFAATTGLFQNDMKRVIAYSTCSQLGYMVFACGLSSYDVAIFHLSNHAFFKALLFLGAGSIIHAVADEQDMRKLGGLKNLLPFSYSVMTIASLALVGFPFLSGYYSKDVILEVAASTYTNVGQFSYFFGLLAAFCTAFYSTRLGYLVFLANPNGNKNTILNVHEGTWKMTLPLFLLANFSVFIGYLTKDLFIGFGTDFWSNAIFVSLENYRLADVEFLGVQYKLLPFIITIVGILLAYFIYTFKLSPYYSVKKSALYKNFYNFFNKKWYFDRVYYEVFATNTLLLSHSYFYKNIDRGLIERVGPLGIYSLLDKLSASQISQADGQILKYLKDFIFFLILSISLIFFNGLSTVIFVVFLLLYFQTLKN